MGLLPCIPCVILCSSFKQTIKTNKSRERGIALEINWHMGMLFKLIAKTRTLLGLLFKILTLNISRMATLHFKSNNLIYTAMNRKTHVRQNGHTYHEEGIGTMTIMLAIITVAIIFYSIYSTM